MVPHAPLTPTPSLLCLLPVCLKKTPATHCHKSATLAIVRKEKEKKRKEKKRKEKKRKEKTRKDKKRKEKKRKEKKRKEKPLGVQY